MKRSKFGSMRLFSRLARNLGCCLVIALFTVPGFAQLSLCNDSGFDLWTAIAYPNGGDWTSQGWWKIESGDCKTLLSGALTSRYYYYYAHTLSGKFTLAGDTSFCVSNEAFRLGRSCSFNQRSESFARLIPVMQALTRCR
jgi:uncharacterized membrane protein